VSAGGDVTDEVPNRVLCKMPKTGREIMEIFGFKVCLGILCKARRDGGNVLSAGLTS
jgi:hypothetical protein